MIEDVDPRILAPLRADQILLFCFEGCDWERKGRNPMRHIERGDERRFLCGRFIGSQYDVDSSERTFQQIKLIVNEPRNLRYLCEGCMKAIQEQPM